MFPSLEYEIRIFSTVNCPEEGGPGSYSLVVMYEEGDVQHSKEFFCNTTIKRLGLMSLIVALSVFAESWTIMMYSDSKYLVDAMTKGWAHRWKSSGWKKCRSEDAENKDLWEELLTICQTQKVKFFEIDNRPDQQYSPISDELANENAMQESLPIDEGCSQPLT